jgi:sucrose-6-phosphate hydrolase SacC (GH32 family)
VSAATHAEEALKLRVFVDKSVVEVFANGRQAVGHAAHLSIPPG